MKNIFLFLSPFLLPLYAWACTCPCGSPSNLCEQLSQDTITNLVECRLIEDHGDSFTYVLMNAIQTKTFVPDTFQITYSSSCEEPPVIAQDGVWTAMDTAIIHMGEGYGEHQFGIFSCNGVALWVDEGMVYGDISGSIKAYPYADFMDYVNGGYVNDPICERCNCRCNNPLWSIRPSPAFSLCQNLLESQPYRDELVVGQFEVIAIQTDRIQIKAIDIIGGNPISDQLWVWGSRGEDCRDDLADFKVGEVHILLLFGIEENERQIETETTNDYFILDCLPTPSVLPLINGDVQAFLQGTALGVASSNSIPYDIYASNLQGVYHGTQECDWIVGIEEYIISSSINIYPNPAQHTLYINSNALVPINTINLVNIQGQIVLEQKITNSSNKALSVEVSHLPTGIYFLTLTIGEKLIVKKVIIE